jgi:hypothetical protein
MSLLDKHDIIPAMFVGSPKGTHPLVAMQIICPEPIYILVQTAIRPFLRVQRCLAGRSRVIRLCCCCLAVHVPFAVMPKVAAELMSSCGRVDYWEEVSERPLSRLPLGVGGGALCRRW